MSAVKTVTTFRELPHRLTENEKLSYGEKLAREHQTLSQVEMAKKQVMAEFKEKMEGHHIEIARLSDAVYSGVEFRQTECEKRFYPASDEVVVIRLDTAILSKRAR